MNKWFLSSVVAGTVVLGTTLCIAQDSLHEFSANVALTTDYSFRGIAQSGEDPAIQGGLDYAHESGFYLGTWASSINFATNTEVDFYGGMAGELDHGLGWDVGGLYYLYPGDSTEPELDYFEVYGSLNYDFGNFDISAGVAYSPDYFAQSGDAIYVSGDVGIPLPQGFSLSGHIGHQSIDENIVFGTPDYIDWSIGVAREIGIFILDLSYVDTDLDDAGCFGDNNLCQAFIFSVSSSF